MLQRLIYLALIISASFALGFLWGYVFGRKKLSRRVQVLENFKQAVKVLCPKIMNGEDMTRAVKRLKKQDDEYIKKIDEIEREKDEDTETAELEVP